MGRLAVHSGLCGPTIRQPANRDVHIATTGPEIWAQTDGRVDAFSCAVGTGGTLAGVAQSLRQLSDGRVRIGLTDPPGAALFRYFRDGELKAVGDSITEGIGQGRVTGNLEGFRPDEGLAFEVDDADALRCAYSLLRDEGLALGLSSGTNVAGAMRVAERLEPGSTVVTVLCDSAHRYASKMFDVGFLEQRGLPVPGWLRRQGGDEVDAALVNVLVGGTDEYRNSFPSADTSRPLVTFSHTHTH